MTEQQLYSKRDEFWDTAPAFDGHAEIWDALKAVTSAFEHQDLELAQAILDCANISLPHGELCVKSHVFICAKWWNFPSPSPQHGAVLWWSG